MLTLDNCRSDRGLVAVARVDPTTQEFTDLINEACRRLLDYGDWWATVVKARFAAYGRYLVWPRWVGTVLAVNDCHIPLRLQNGWYDFLPLDPNDWEMICRSYPHREKMRGNALVNELGTVPVFHNVPENQSNYILAYPRSANDNNKTLSLWGNDTNGSFQSETLVLASPFVASTLAYANISRVQKDVTRDYVDLYQCITQVPGTLAAMGSYEPGETRGEYRSSMVRSHNPFWRVASDGTQAQILSALIKIQFIPAVAGSDLVSIGNAAALKLMLLSIHKEEAADPQGAELETQRAIHELNRELNNKLPEYQTPVSYEEIGGVNLSRQSAF